MKLNVFILTGFGPALGLCDASPFVIKVETYLRLAGIGYDKVNRPQAVRSAPKGKLPVMHHGTTTVADSSDIVAYVNQHFAVDLDAHLTPEQRANALVLQRSVEEYWYWIGVYMRGVPEATWPEVRASLFARMPAPMRALLPALVRRSMKAQLHAQGLGRHREAEILAQGELFLNALSTALGARRYWFGDQPTSIDATLYGFLAVLILGDLDTPLRRSAMRCDNLVAYVGRLHATYFHS
jgi:glutathione S-transferase